MATHVFRLSNIIATKRAQHIPQTIKSSITYKNIEHACVIMNKSGSPLSYGYNSFKLNTPGSEHAEAMAFRKLSQTMKIKGIRKNIAVNVLVVRTNGGNSKPCTNCIDRMALLSNNITIRKVFYTQSQGLDNLEKKSFQSLLNDSNKYVSSFYQVDTTATETAGESDTETVDDNKDSDDDEQPPKT